MRNKSLSMTGILRTFSIILILALPVLSVHPAFAARMFEDGFETGDFRKWSVVVIGPFVTSGDAHHGAYKAVLDAAGQYAQFRFASAAVDHCFMRAYVMFKSFPATGTETTILGVYNQADNRYMAEARVRNVNGTVKWELRYYDNGVHYRAISEQWKPVLNNWYCVEVEGKSSTTTNAESRLYVDGNELTDVSQTGRSNDLQITCAYVWASTAVTRWYDCVVVDTAYVGPEDIWGHKHSISVIIDRFMTTPNDSRWDPNCDIDNDLTVDMADVSIAIDHFVRSLIDNFMATPPNWDPNLDINGDLTIDMADVTTALG